MMSGVLDPRAPAWNRQEGQHRRSSPGVRTKGREVCPALGWPPSKALPLSPAQENSKAKQKQQKESLPGPPGVSLSPPPSRGRGVQCPSFLLA